MRAARNGSALDKSGKESVLTEWSDLAQVNQRRIEETRNALNSLKCQLQELIELATVLGAVWKGEFHRLMATDEIQQHPKLEKTVI